MQKATRFLSYVLAAILTTLLLHPAAIAGYDEGYEGQRIFTPPEGISSVPMTDENGVLIINIPQTESGPAFGTLTGA